VINTIDYITEILVKMAYRNSKLESSEDEC